VKCRLQDQCPFHVRAVWSEERGWVRVAKVDPEHTCLGAALPVRSVAIKDPLYSNPPSSSYN